MAIKNVVSSHLTLATLLSYSHTTIAPLPSLSVFPIAQTIGHQLHSLNATTTSSTDWCAKVCQYKCNGNKHACTFVLVGYRCLP